MTLTARALAPTLAAYCAIGAPALTPAANADIPNYQLVGQFDLPGRAVDVLPDGRIIHVGTDGTISIQDSVNASTYSVLGSTDLAINSFGASFLRVSPDGTTLAIGDGNFGAGASVGLVDIASLNLGGPTSAQSVLVGNFEAHWADNSTLYVTGADNTTFDSSAFRVDTNALSVETLVTGIGSGSGGITTDGINLFIGNGFDTSDAGDPTGNVRTFALGSLGGAARDYATDGLLVADALSGNSLGFDDLGNLLIGGGDFFAGSNDFGYGAVLDADALADAIAGLGVVADSDELQLSPAGPSASYTMLFNGFTGELLVMADDVAYRFAVPAPSVLVLAGFAGAFAGRRRR